MPEAEIRRLADERAARISRREFDEMATAFYADDAVLLPSAAETVRGLAAIRAFWRDASERGLVALSLDTKDVEASGDLAYELGSFNRTLRPRHGAPFQERGKYLVIYRSEGDGWRAVAEMFNTDRPR